MFDLYFSGLAAKCEGNDEELLMRWDSPIWMSVFERTKRLILRGLEKLSS